MRESRKSLSSQVSRSWRDTALRSQPATQSVSTAPATTHGVGAPAQMPGHGWRHRLAPVRSGLARRARLAAGVRGRADFLTGGPTSGQLKTSLSHLEYENQQLKRSVAKLEQENRAMEDRLVQEQIDNGDLTARLDDARNLLRDRGLDPDVRARSPARSMDRHSAARTSHPDFAGRPVIAAAAKTSVCPDLRAGRRFAAGPEMTTDQPATGGATPRSQVSPARLRRRPGSSFVLSTARSRWLRPWRDGA